MSRRRWGVARAGMALALALAPAAATAAPAKQRVDAVVIERAASPVLHALERQLGERWNLRAAGARELRHPRRFDALVVDGDAISPRQLSRRAAAMRHFLAAGRAVVALDMRGSHLRRALRKVTGIAITPAAARGSRHRLILIQRRSTGLASRFSIVEAQRLGPRGIARLPRSRRAQVRQQGTRRVAATILRRLGAQQAGRRASRSRPLPPRSPNVDAGIPDDLQHVSWTYARQDGTVLPGPYFDQGNREQLESRKRHFIAGGGLELPAQGTQTANWSMTHTFDAYLDNAQRPTGNFQVVSYHLNGEFSPKEPKQRFAYMETPFEVPNGWGGTRSHWIERAWWTGLAEISVEPDAAAAAKLFWQASSPSTPNEESSYSSGTEFSVGFEASKGEGPGIDAEYTVSSHTEHTIHDWGVDNRTAGVKAAWEFSSRNPCDMREGQFDWGRCFDRTFGHDSAPQRPADLSLGQLPLDVYARWNTKRPLGPGDGRLTFDISTPITLVDTYCEAWVLAGWCADDALRRRTHALGAQPGETMRVSFDVGDLIPVGIESVSFDPAVANGARNEKVTGTVRLKEAARLPSTTVTIYSDSANAIVGEPYGRGSATTVEIPRGQRSATFELLTNDNGLGKRGHTTAQITAFYTEPTVAQLRVTG